MSATHEMSPSARPRRRRFPRYWTGFVGLLIALVWTLPLEIDFGLRLTSSFVLTVFYAAGMFVWAMGFSGYSMATRGGIVAAIALMLATSAAAVRRIEFSGDMIPSVDLRWTESREDRLDRHRSAQKQAKTEKTEVQLEPISEEDVAEYRGRARDGIYVGPAIQTSFSPPPKPLWKEPVGGGYASFAVVGNWLVTLEQRRENEAIVCYDANTGKEAWIYEYPALFQEKMGGDGPRATPTIHGGNVYCLGATGKLLCLKGTDGTKLWEADILEQDGVKNLEWGMSGSPLVHDGKVIVNPGAQGGRETSYAVAAYDANDGKILWKSGHAQASYASPMLATLAGRLQVLIFDAEGLAGLDHSNGQECWRFPWKTAFDINASQPIVVDEGNVFVTSQNGAALINVSEQEGKFVAKSLWENRLMKCHYANPIAKDGYVYGLDGGILACLDLKTGKRQWKGGRYGHGQMLLADNSLLILTEQGDVAVVEASPKEHQESARFPAIEGKTWNNPVLCRGKLYVRNHLEMAAFDLLKGPTTER